MPDGVNRDINGTLTLAQHRLACEGFRALDAGLGDGRSCPPHRLEHTAGAKIGVTTFESKLAVSCTGTDQSTDVSKLRWEGHAQAG